MNALKKLIDVARTIRRVESKEYYDNRVATDPEVSLITGRNGTFALTALEIEEWQMQGIRVLEIKGIGARYEPIKGGLRVTAECFEEMCWRYLLRGLEKYEYEEEEEKAG